MKKFLSLILTLTAVLATATTATATSVENIGDSTQNPEIVYVYVPVPSDSEEKDTSSAPAHNPLPKDHEMPDEDFVHDDGVIEAEEPTVAEENPTLATRLWNACCKVFKWFFDLFD